MKWQDGRTGYLEFAAVSLLLILSISIIESESFASYSANAFLLLIFVSFTAFVLLHAAYANARNQAARRKLALVQHSLFAMALAFFLAAVVSSYAPIGAMGDVLVSLVMAAYFFVLFIPLFFFMFVGASIVRKDNGKLRVAAVLFAVAFLILLLYFSSGFLLKQLNINDEEFLQFHAAALTLEGVNPYTVLLSEPLFYNASTVGVSITTGNTIVGMMDYPALYFLSFIPFYAVSSPSLYNAGHFDIPFQMTIFLFLLLLALAFALKKEELLKPRLALLAFVLFSVVVTVSVTDYLMLALLVLAYAKMGSRYAWLPLGLCASLQEELWLPVIFLLVYSFNSYGWKKGFRDVAGTLAIFLVINSYFIATAPTAYLSSVLTPLNGFYLPSGLGAVGAALMDYYPVLMSTYTHLFDVVTVVLILVFAYFNRKELVGLFSLIPLVFLVHVLPAYYTFFIFVTFFAFFAEKERRRSGPGALGAALRRHKPVFASVVVLLVAYAVYSVIVSHSAYASNFNVSLVNGTLQSDIANYTSHYSATLVYHNLSNSTVYAYALLYNSRGGSILGFINYSILTSPHSAPDCGSYRCEINVNRIVLNGSSGTYALAAGLKWLNGNRPTEYAAIALYNDDYFYLSPVVRNTTAG